MKAHLRLHSAPAQALVAGLIALAAMSSAAAQGVSDWALTKLDRVVKLNKYASVTGQHFDGQGGWSEITIDGRTLDLCPGGWERVRFDWKFPQNINHLPSGGGASVTLEARIAGLNPPCRGDIAAISDITLRGSGDTWPYDPAQRKEIDVDRFYREGSLPYVRANQGPKTTTASIRLNTREVNPAASWSFFSLQIALRGGGELWYLYFYKTGAQQLGGGNLTVEPGTDRMGGDYVSFDLGQPNFQLCRQACANDNRCLAYTYVHPGVQSASARCWLKSTVPVSQANACCISGVRQ